MVRASDLVWRLPGVTACAGMMAVLSAMASGPVFAIAMLTANAVLLLILASDTRRRARRTQPVPPLEGLSSSAAPIAIAAPGHRATTSHPVSGLPVREALLARMTADGAGMLGAISFADFDRLTVFDPAMSEGIFAAMVDRLRRMLPPERLVAQVDRGKLGVWFADDAVAGAKAELDAIGYALGQAIDLGGTQIVPEIKLRLGCFDGAAGADPGAFLARTLASFALPETAAVSPAPLAHYAEYARERYALEQDFRQALLRRELGLVFQPLIDAGQGCVSGAEALLRWDHPRLGPISPTRFIPIMEATGLASEVGLWAMNAALREAHGWAQLGLGRLRVAVNVSALQLERDDLPVLVKRTLQRHELTAAALEIELTESVATSDADHCRRIFAELRTMGVKLAVDDFGTGYSGFASLRGLAFDKIKIDRAFVTDVDTRRDSQAICQSIVALGRGLGIRVLAEGVERVEEYEWLRRHGCQHFQGYYFARPLTADAFRTFARDTVGLHNLLRRHPSPAGIEERLRA